MNVPSPYLNQTEAGSLLGLSVRTLERFRWDGRGPKYLKLGRRVVYAREDLTAWAESRRRASTSDTATPPARPRLRHARRDHGERRAIAPGSSEPGCDRQRS